MSRRYFGALQSPTQKDIDYFESILNRKGSILTSPSDLEAYNHDWTNLYKGDASIVLKPKTKSELSQIVHYCNHNKIGIVPQGGNTGLVGGSIPTSSTQIIISTSNLNRIHDFDEWNGMVTCDAGCILSDLQSYVSERNHMVPLDIGAKGSCQIGGNVSTNAGGQYYYRFGSLKESILGIEVVLPNGSILDLMNWNRKDNTGYDLKQLFIGAEGTLGIITKVVMSCPPLPTSKHAALLGMDSMKDVLSVLKLAKQELGEILSALELMDQAILNLVGRQYSIPIQNSQDENFPFTILVETQGSNRIHDAEKVESFLELCMEREYVKDGILCQDESQGEEIKSHKKGFCFSWRIRESCNPIIKDQGYVYKYDVTVPIPEYNTLAEEVKDLLSASQYPNAITVIWGHVLDGNVHLNIVIPGKFDFDPKFSEWLEQSVYKRVIQMKGSISAEHGIGQSKRQYLNMQKDEETLDWMYQVKHMFDPNGIMNPGKYLPERT